ncbi:DUF6197 family protein [Hamadaea tsunoensis]|uniref:DUF6197 family protein n=1 Tax=Hamadaea tsunoensis TaxID=53368 RepID=UPI0004252717|nr:hypothetical protein [Hamadaea tsunoensis]
MTHKPTFTKPDTPAGVLRAAALYLEQHGWTRDNYYPTGNTPFPPACVVGAIGMTVHGKPFATPLDTHRPGHSLLQAAILILTDYLGLPASIDADDLIGWNDHDATDAAHVIHTLRAAADWNNGGQR